MKKFWLPLIFIIYLFTYLFVQYIENDASQSQILIQFCFLQTNFFSISSYILSMMLHRLAGEVISGRIHERSRVGAKLPAHHD